MTVGRSTNAVALESASLVARDDLRLSRLLRLLLRKPVLACADQSIVSATSFLTLIMIAHATDVAQVGVFALGVSVIGVALAVQHSLISLPYTIQRHRPVVEASHHAFSCLTLSVFMAVGWAVALGMSAFVLSFLASGSGTGRSIWLLTAAVPLVLLREFARDFDIARVNLCRALAVDVGAASLQLALIAYLAVSKQLSPESAYGAMAVAHGASFLVWIVAARGDFAIGVQQLREHASECWRLGRWLLVSKAGLLVQGYSTYWISMIVAGPKVTGVYAACMSIVSLANPVVMGLYNVLMPRSVEVWRERGGAALYRQAIRDALLLCALTFCFFAAVLVGGETLLTLLYPQDVGSGQGETATLLAFGLLVSALGIPPANALASMERPRPSAGIAAAAAGLNVVLVWAFLDVWGLLGAAAAIAVVNFLSSAARWVVLYFLLNRNPSNRVAPSGMRRMGAWSASERGAIPHPDQPLKELPGAPRW